MNSETGHPRGGASRLSTLLAALAAVLLLLIFLTGVKGLGDGFKLLGGNLLYAFFSATENPFIALMVGLLATTLVQSSSVTTSMVVGLVAAPDNPLPLANAVPIIMGANIGTTVTNTIVSIAHIRSSEEFRRAFSVATCHDFFNLLSVLVMLPLEVTTGVLSRSASALADRLDIGSTSTFEGPLAPVLAAGTTPLKALTASLFDAPHWQGVVIVIGSGLMIFGALALLVRVLRSTLLVIAEPFLQNALGHSGLTSLAIGCVITAMVQSSSITTSLLVPLAGVGLMTLEQAFPVTIGANVGTTITALMASLAVSGPNAHAGVEIALTHLAFNIAGTLLIYPWAPIRNLVLGAVRWFANVAVRSKLAAISYLLVLFFGLPALAAFLS